MRVVTRNTDPSIKHIANVDLYSLDYGYKKVCSSRAKMASLTTLILATGEKRVWNAFRHGVYGLTISAFTFQSGTRRNTEEPSVPLYAMVKVSFFSSMSKPKQNSVRRPSSLNG